MATIPPVYLGYEERDKTHSKSKVHPYAQLSIIREQKKRWGLSRLSQISEDSVLLLRGYPFDLSGTTKGSTQLVWTEEVIESDLGSI